MCCWSCKPSTSLTHARAPACGSIISSAFYNSHLIHTFISPGHMAFQQTKKELLLRWLSGIRSSGCPPDLRISVHGGYWILVDLQEVCIPGGLDSSRSAGSLYTGGDWILVDLQDFCTWGGEGDWILVGHIVWLRPPAAVKYKYRHHQICYQKVFSYSQIQQCYAGSKEEKSRIFPYQVFGGSRAQAAPSCRELKNVPWPGVWGQQDPGCTLVPTPIESSTIARSYWQWP